MTEFVLRVSYYYYPRKSMGNRESGYVLCGPDVLHSLTHSFNPHISQGLGKQSLSPFWGMTEHITPSQGGSLRKDRWSCQDTGVSRSAHLDEVSSASLAQSEVPSMK